MFKHEILSVINDNININVVVFKDVHLLCDRLRLVQNVALG